MKSLETVVKGALRSLGVDRSQPVLLAFSGGLDSSVLLEILVNVLGGKKVRAAYVCHNLRPKEELEREIALIHAICRTKKVQLTLVYIREGAIVEYAKRTKCGIEAAARRFRYHALARTARRWSISTIITAHHADDQVETFLMRLMRGGSLGSLAGISASRTMERNPEIHVLRPLLQVERRALRDYAEKKGLCWSEDSTNEKSEFLRNRVRNVLVPYLDSQFRSWKSAILGYASQIGEAEAFLRTFAHGRAQAMQREDQGGPALDLDLFKREPAAVRRRILQLFLQSLDIGDHLGLHAVQSLQDAIATEALKAEAEGYEFDLSKGLLRCRGKARFSSASGARNASLLLDAYREDQYFLKVHAYGEYKCGDFRLIVAREPTRGESSEIASIALPLAFPFVLRNRKEGDILHTETGVRRIDVVLKEAGVSANERHLVPMLEDRYGIAAVFFPAVMQGPTVLCREPSLGEDREIIYITLLNERRS